MVSKGVPCQTSIRNITKSVEHLMEVDVYAVHHLFGINDPFGAIQHASKKLLLSGVRTGGKSVYDDIREARDTLTRWLELQASLSWDFLHLAQGTSVLWVL